MRHAPLVLLVLLAAAPLSLAYRAGEILPNGGFEHDADADGVPDGWALHSRGTLVSEPTCALARSTDAFTGAWSLLITNSAGGRCLAATDPFPAAFGQQFDLSVMGKRLSGSVDVRLMIWFYDVHGSYLGSWGNAFSAQGSDWAPMNAVGTAPTGTASARVLLQAAWWDQPSGGAMLYDDASAVRV